MTSVVRLKARLHTGDPGASGIDNISAVNPNLVDICMAVREGWNWVAADGGDPQWWRRDTTVEETVYFMSVWNEDQQLVFVFPINADGTGYRWKKKIQSLTVHSLRIESTRVA